MRHALSKPHSKPKRAKPSGAEAATPSAHEAHSPASNARNGAFYAAGPAISLGGPVQAKTSRDPAQGLDLEQEETQAEPIQQKCSACEAEEATGGKEPVQFWDCTEYTEPTCKPIQKAAADSPVQSKCAACEEEQLVQQAGRPSLGPRMIQREARRGLKDAAGPLPHGEQIQEAFGRHDISQVQASVGGTAEHANRRMGSLAFTSGQRIGFRAAPSLRLAAHEAAHVVQQREGLRLPDNLGRPGDPWERHADRVADAVAGGRSAEPLLDEVAKPDAASARPAGGTESGQAAPAVQPQITSRASRLWEPLPTPDEPSLPAPGAGEKIPKRPTEEAEPKDRTEEEPAMEAAKKGDTESPPEGVPSQAAATPAAATEGGEAESKSGPKDISEPCYKPDVEPPPPPEGAKEPDKDKKGSEPEKEPQITFEPWPAEIDECPPKALKDGKEQIPEGIGKGSEMAGGVFAARAETALSEKSASQEPALASAKVAGGSFGSAPGQSPASGAAGGADQSAGETNLIDGQISSAESGRDLAVVDYLASAEGLGEASTQAERLPAGLSFPASRDQAGFARSQVALEVMRSFMARMADQIGMAAAFVQTQVPSRLGQAAELTKAAIQESIETEKASISARIEESRLQARIGAAMAVAHVHAEYASSASRVESVTRDAVEALDEKHNSSVDLADEKETKGLDDVNSRFATGRADHEAKGPLYAQKALAKGQEHASKYEVCKVHPETHVNYDDDGFWDGCLNVRRAKAQQDAACETAAGYEDAFLQTANKKGHDLIELRRQYRCAVIAGAQQVDQTLDDTHAQLVSGLESGRAQAQKGLAMARDESLAAINQALAGTLKSLSVQELTQRQAVNDTGYLKQLAVEQLAHASASGLARGVSTAARSLERTLAMLRNRITNGDVPDPATLAESLAITEAKIGGGMGQLLAGMENGAEAAEERIVDLGAASLEGLALVTSKNQELCGQVEGGFAGQMGQLKAGASKVFGQLTENHVAQAVKAKTDGTASMDKAVAGFDKALGTIGGKVDEAIAASLKELEKTLDEKYEKIDAQIAHEAWKAAAKEQPAWKSVVAILLVILVIIAATLISLATLGAGAGLFATILVGALVGAVSGGLIQLINNWASGAAWHEGLAQAMIMGAIGGAIGGGFGYAGGALVRGAAMAGARLASQAAVTIGADLVAEGLTQTVGFVAFGQKFNWQGFVMAGAMSGATFRAHPGAGRPNVPSPAQAGAAGGRRAIATQIGGGAALGLALEYGAAKISGEKFDAAKAASAAASAAVGVRMSRRGGPTRPTPEPTTRLGSATKGFRTFDPGGLGAKLETRLEALGGRMGGAQPQTGAPTARPLADELATRPTDEPDTPEARSRNAHWDEPEIEPGVVAKVSGPDGHEYKVLQDGTVARCSDCDRLRNHELVLADPLLRARLGTIESIGDAEVKAQKAAEFAAELKARLELEQKIQHAEAEVKQAESQVQKQKADYELAKQRQLEAEAKAKTATGQEKVDARKAANDAKQAAKDAQEFLEIARQLEALAKEQATEVRQQKLIMKVQDAEELEAAKHEEVRKVQGQLDKANRTRSESIEAAKRLQKRPGRPEEKIDEAQALQKQIEDAEARIKTLEDRLRPLKKEWSERQKATLKELTALQVEERAARGITEADYQALRKKTPNDKIRKEIQKQTKDAVYGTDIAGTPEADHIVSMHEITQMDGFNLLSPDQRVKVLNHPDNFMALDKRVNASKGDRSFSEWEGHPEFGDIPTAKRKEMLQKEAELRIALQKMIDKMRPK